MDTPPGDTLQLPSLPTASPAFPSRSEYRHSRSVGLQEGGWVRLIRGGKLVLAEAPSPVISCPEGRPFASTGEGRERRVC